MKTPCMLLCTAALTLGAACGPADDQPASTEVATTDQGLFVNACGNELTPISVRSRAITWPYALTADYVNPPYTSVGRFSRGGLEYLSGNDLTLSIQTDGCTTVRSVTENGVALANNAAGGQGFQVSTTGTTTGALHVITIKLPQRTDGFTEPLVVTLARVDNRKVTPLMTQLSWTLVRSYQVDAMNVSQAVIVSGAELKNQFARALWQKFNGAANSTTVTLADGTVKHLFAYDPSSLGVYPTSGGVNFSFRFRSDEGDGCWPRVTAHGSFAVVAQSGSELSIRWAATPVGEVDLFDGCANTPTQIFISAVVESFFNGQTTVDLRSALEAEINGSLPQIGLGRAYLYNSTSSSGGVAVNFRLPVPTVSISVPYVSLGEPAASVSFPSGAVIGLFGRGITRVDNIYSGPNGLPSSASYPAATTLARVDSALPWPGRAVAQVGARSATQSQYQWLATPGCRLNPTGPLSFGLNDTPADAARNRSWGASGYVVGLAFYDAETLNILKLGTSPCASKGADVVQF